MGVKSIIRIVSGVIVGTLIVVYAVFWGLDYFKWRPDIVLITVDTLRADHLSNYGYTMNTSPHIDQFTEDALVFENCLSHAPVTCSSVASILSGFLPHETRVFNNQTLPSGVVTIPEILRREGYKTVAVVSNYVLSGKRGFKQGFMIYDDTMDDRELVRNRPERIAEHTTNRAIELLKQFHKDHLFMWIHYQDPHGPYTPPSSFAESFQDPGQKPRYLTVNNTVSGAGGIPSYQRLGENTNFYYYISQYDSEIRYLDENFQRLINELKELGLYDDALIILTADHGEGMGEHNYYFAHGENIYSSLTHVPLVIKYGKELIGRRTEFVQHIDIVPTVFKFLGIKTDSRFRGRDLLESVVGKREIFAEMRFPPFSDRYIFSIVMDGIKLIYRPWQEQYQLFNLKTDPHEEHNLFGDAEYRELAEDLKVRLNRVCNEDFLQLGIVEKPRELTDEEKEKLRSLGYIQ